MPAWPFCASTIALTIEIAVTSTAGIAVQTISSLRVAVGRRPVGVVVGPARNFQTE